MLLTLLLSRTQENADIKQIHNPLDASVAFYIRYISRVRMNCIFYLFSCVWKKITTILIGFHFHSSVCSWGKEAWAESLYEHILFGNRNMRPWRVHVGFRNNLIPLINNEWQMGCWKGKYEVSASECLPSFGCQILSWKHLVERPRTCMVCIGGAENTLLNGT